MVKLTLDNYFPDKPSYVVGTYNFRNRGSCAYGCFFDEKNAKMYGEHLHKDLMLSSSVIYIASDKGNLFFTEDYKEKNRWTEFEKTIVYDGETDSEYRLYDIVAGNVDLDRDLEDDEDEDEDDELERW
jgi:hypothetical protein